MGPEASTPEGGALRPGGLAAFRWRLAVLVHSGDWLRVRGLLVERLVKSSLATWLLVIEVILRLRL